MSTHVDIECPPEVLLEAHFTAEELGRWLKEKGAVAFYREGKISSGLAARWLGVPRVQFLTLAMREGVVLGTESVDDVRRETALL